MMADTLRFTETPLIDESIDEYEYPEYDLIIGTNLNINVLTYAIKTAGTAACAIAKCV